MQENPLVHFDKIETQIKVEVVLGKKSFIDKVSFIGGGLEEANRLC